MAVTGLLHPTVAGDGHHHLMGITHHHHRLGLEGGIGKTKGVGHAVGLHHHFSQLGQTIENVHLQSDPHIGEHLEVQLYINQVINLETRVPHGKGQVLQEMTQLGKQKQSPQAETLKRNHQLLRKHHLRLKTGLKPWMVLRRI